MSKLLTALSFFVTVAMLTSSKGLAASVYHGDILPGSLITEVTCGSGPSCTLTAQRQIFVSGKQTSESFALLCNHTIAEVAKKFVTDYRDLTDQRLTLFSALNKDGNMWLIGIEARSSIYFTDVASPE